MIGFGAWAIGGPWRFGWGPVDDDESIAAIRRAVELGVNWVDTAAVYGLGHSEEVVARALRAYRVGDDVLVFTKCGRRWEGRPRGVIGNDLRPESIREECERQPAPPRPRADRPVPVPLAGLDDGDAARGVVGDDGRARRRGKGPLDRRLQLRRRAARSLRGGAARRLGAAAALAPRPWRPLDRRAVGRRARRRRDRLLAARLGPALRRVRPRPHRGSRRGRRAPGRARVPGASRLAEPRSRRAALAPRGQARDDAAGRRDRVGARSARRDGEIVGARLPRHVDGWAAAAELALDDRTLHEIGAAIVATGAGSDVPPAPPPHIKRVRDRPERRSLHETRPAFDSEDQRRDPRRRGGDRRASTSSPSRAATRRRPGVRAPSTASRGRTARTRRCSATTRSTPSTSRSRTACTTSGRCTRSPPGSTSSARSRTRAARPRWRRHSTPPRPPGSCSWRRSCTATTRRPTEIERSSARAPSGRSARCTASFTLPADRPREHPGERRSSTAAR